MSISTRIVIRTGNKKEKRTKKRSTRVVLNQLLTKQLLNLSNLVLESSASGVAALIAAEHILAMQI